MHWAQACSTMQATDYPISPPPYPGASWAAYFGPCQAECPRPHVRLLSPCPVVVPLFRPLAPPFPPPLLWSVPNPTFAFKVVHHSPFPSLVPCTSLRQQRLIGEGHCSLLEVLYSIEANSPKCVARAFCCKAEFINNHADRDPTACCAQDRGSFLG